MYKPPLPEDENDRLRALHSLKILDTLPEERFDRVTRLARYLFNVPIAVVSLVDQNRQWFKSIYGLKVTQTSRDISFCGHTILDRKPLIVEDATSDPRFTRNPLVLGDPNIRFYAGVPLLYDEKLKLGTLCIIDSQPRVLNETQIQDLTDLAKMVERELSTSLSSTVDELTFLSNRRGFSCLAKKALRYCKFCRYPFSLAYIRFDGVKKGGDKSTLKLFAQLVSNMSRDSDILARVDEDVFVIFMVGAIERVALTAISRLKKAAVLNVDSRGIKQNLSFEYGVASGSYTDELTVAGLIGFAYQNMSEKINATH
ncbi:sensor domain-containing diguanylate cyclase [Vibrio marisflavi]|uniref:GGDEF domain-containing protein n=1 Tax=Vibrio marisflavi CECT 7928 TaxID=634439 RepID=A0ABN8E1T4_9VIBR|nr:GAF domain-containing protein [Vibrio marisflavi]CAH0536808.1 hypothetical protein VMF7928_00698 [Vibrio marisflavi CECT 7928]